MKTEDRIKISDLFSDIPYWLDELFSDCVYPWEILPKINDYTKKLVSDGIEGYSLLSEGVIVGENVIIADNVIIFGPCVIGSGTAIRPGAYIRGSVIIGNNCVIGNSTELKNCVLLDKVQAPHYNYIGDSILGCGSHMGAGSICSNLKSDKSDITVHGINDYNTGLHKFGAILGNGVEIGCGSVLNPGSVIGKNTSVYPLTSVRGVIPADSIIKTSNNIIKRI